MNSQEHDFVEKEQQLLDANKKLLLIQNLYTEKNQQLESEMEKMTKENQRLATENEILIGEIVILKTTKEDGKL